MQPILVIFSVPVIIPFTISIAISIWMTKRKIHLLLIISTVLTIAVSLFFCVIYFGPSIWIR